MSQLGKARFEAASFLEYTKALCELAKTQIQVGNPLGIVELALQDFFLQLALRNVRPALDLISQLREARFKTARLFKYTNALCELSKTPIQVCNTLQLIDRLRS